ncbi:hypothetical protein [uncultured Sphingomonas sp.]|uniref:hypothetical protein n=1 Tax=uncultured Sphingomonas sp. TaxID=158754 RepID=UPI0025E42771|nr:hypothetical protein [uncultured Sphingomonas sp.]
MSEIQVREARARGEADAAKARLMGDVDELKARLAPGKLASDAVQTAKDKSIVAADGAVTAAKQKPGVAAGIGAGVLLLLARKPLFRAVTGLFRRKNARGDDYENTGRRRAASSERYQ